jgi:hypothetical protein
LTDGLPATGGFLRLPHAALVIERLQVAAVAVARWHPRHDVGVVHQAMVAARQEWADGGGRCRLGHRRLAEGVHHPQRALHCPGGGRQQRDRAAEAVARHQDRQVEMRLQQLLQLLAQGAELPPEAGVHPPQPRHRLGLPPQVAQPVGGAPGAAEAHQHQADGAGLEALG